MRTPPTSSSLSLPCLWGSVFETYSVSCLIKLSLPLLPTMGRRKPAHSLPLARRLPVPPSGRPSVHDASSIVRKNQQNFVESLGTRTGPPAVTSSAGTYPAPDCGRFAAFISNNFSYATEGSL